MKLALAHDHLFQVGGAENILKEFSAIYPQAPIYTLIHDRKKSDLFLNNQVVTSYLQSIPGGVKFFKLFLPFMPSAWESFDFSDYDVVLSSSSAFVKGLIVQPKTVHITYCHSPTRYLWSDYVSYVDQLRLAVPVKSYLRVLLSKLRIWDQQAAQRVDYFLANSNFVADRIKKYYQRDSQVIYPPVNISDFSVADDLGDYYLLLSRLRPYKRADLAIKAFNALRIPLVIIGAGEEEKYLKKLAKDNIKFVGEVSNQERNRLLSHCRALIHPQEEDFGIAAVEAMASGRPVIAYGKGGGLETVVDGLTGKFFFDQNWEALADTVVRFNYQEFSPQAIRQQAENFDEQIFRDKISKFVNSVSDYENSN